MREEATIFIRNLHQMFRRFQRSSAHQRDKSLLAEQVNADAQGCLHHLVQAQAERMPDALAVEWGAEALTYRDLIERANRLARHLHTLGVGPDVVVGICLERSLDMVVAMLAVLIAGGAYLPLDPSYPVSRLRFLLEDANALAVVTHKRQAERLSPPHAAIVCMDGEGNHQGNQGNEVFALSEHPPRTAVSPSNLAYVIYTSGSTGQPKGVLVEHGSIVAYLHAIQEYFHLRPGDRLLQFASMSFDVSVEEIFASLAFGATLVLRTEGMLGSALTFLAHCKQAAITVLDLPTAFWHDLAIELRDRAIAIPECLRLVVIGGEQALSEPLHAWTARVGTRVRLLNLYGPTEATVSALVCDLTHLLDANEESTESRVPIGRPLPHIEVAVLDQNQQPVAPGQPGEFYLGGPGIARGYLDRPDLTERHFLSSLPGQRQDMRFYRTGDLVRALPDGDFEFLGRADLQVKIRGYRIELGEIENAILAHPWVQQVAIAVHDDGMHLQRLVAYVVLRAGTGNSVVRSEKIEEQLEELDADLAAAIALVARAHLPEYMIPTRWMRLGALPLSPTGKLDRGALAALPVLASEQTREVRSELEREAFRGEAGEETTGQPLEQVIAQIWVDVLRIPFVSPQESFFEQGGDSLAAMRALAQIEVRCGVALPFSTFMQLSSIAACAAEVEARRSALRVPGESDESIARREREAHLPSIPTRIEAHRTHEAVVSITHAQKRMWLIEQMEPERPLYNLPLALRIQGPVDGRALEEALQMIVMRHDALRARFLSVDGQPQQVIDATHGIRITFLDWQGIQSGWDLGHSRVAEEVDDQITPGVREWGLHEIQRPFDLTRGPLMRATLLQLGPSDFLLLVVAHHMIMDGWSYETLLAEWATIYNALREGARAPSLPVFPASYGEVIAWQNQQAQQMRRQELLDFWRRRLDGAPTLFELPWSHPRPPMQRYRGKHHRLLLSPQLTEQLMQLARQGEVTLYMLLLAAFETLLFRTTGTMDFLIGSPVADRSHPMVEPVVGCFLNTIVLRADLRGDPRFRELLARVRKVCIAAYEHRELPFDAVVDALSPARNASHSPLIQTLFVLQNTPTSSASFDGLTVSPLPLESGTAQFDLTLECESTPFGIAATFEYSTDLFDDADIRRMAGYFQRLLESIVADPDACVSQLSILAPEERRQLLDEWSRAPKTMAYPSPRLACFHELFEEQVSRTPDAVAALFGDQRLTYDALNRRANQVARYLRSIGVGPEARVGVYMERSLDLLVALLGISKAGGAYVPVDPRYPSERVASILGDASPHALMCGHAPFPNSSETQQRIVCLPDMVARLALEADTNPKYPCRVDQLAYVIYTSGSTGNPKGVMVTHRGIGNLAAAQQGAFSLDQRSRVLQFASVSFDASVFEVALALFTGATLIIAPPVATLSTEEFVKFLGDQQISVATLPPSLLTGLPADAPQRLPLLQTLIVAGEACPASVVEHWAPRRVMINAYGPTEATIWATFAVCTPGQGAPPIGRAICNMEAYVLDAALQPVPAGVVGQLYLGGVGLARGYLNQLEMTAERFLAHPFSPEPDARLYQTGDWVRHLPSGDLIFIGRMDRQVKWRGHRIELGEIERRLEQCAGVREAVAQLREDATGQSRLVAYLVATEAPPPATRVVRQFMQEALPSFMVPTDFLWLERLPLTPNGKIDRASLPPPARDAGRDGADEQIGRAPVTQEEHILEQIWCTLLGLTSVGVDDNFYELGGDSLLGMQMVARAQQAGLALTGRDVMLRPTIASLASLAQQSSIRAHDDKPVTGPTPLTPGQVRSLEPAYVERHHWNISFLFQTPPNIEATVWEQAVQHIWVHHDALRMRIVERAGQWTQEIAGIDTPTPFLQISLAENGSEEEQTSAIEAEAARLQYSLNLSEGPLFRVALFDLGGQKNARLLIIVHHLVADILSASILLEDLNSAVEALRSGQPVRVPPMTHSFRAWATHLEEYAQSDEIRLLIDSWITSLGIEQRPIPRLPLDDASGSISIATLQSVDVQLTSEETQRFLRLAAAHPTPQHTEILLAAVVQALAMWTGNERFSFDLASHGRPDLFADLDVSHTVGFFALIAPFYVDIGQSARTSQHATVLDIIRTQYQRLPQHGAAIPIARYLSRDRSLVERLRRLPQPQVRLNYLGQEERLLGRYPLFQPASESPGPAAPPQNTLRCPLNFDAFIAGGQLQMSVLYSDTQFRRATVDTLAQACIQALRQLLDDELT